MMMMMMMHSQTGFLNLHGRTREMGGAGGQGEVTKRQTLEYEWPPLVTFFHLLFPSSTAVLSIIIYIFLSQTSPPLFLRPVLCGEGLVPINWGLLIQ